MSQENMTMITLTGSLLMIKHGQLLLGLKNSHFIIPKIIKGGLRPGFANLFT
jgi:hypothetical protein